MTEFRLASAEDDALLRSLLRDNSMSSWVNMSLEREPSFFAEQGIWGRDWAVIAQADGRPFGMYTAAVGPLYVNGAAVNGAYLGGLRVQASERHKIRHLRQGYASIGRLAPLQPDMPWWFTVIATENTRARRVLEAGLRGLPTYRPLGAMTTYAIAASRGRRLGLWRQAAPGDVPAMLQFHASQAGEHQLAPVLTQSLVQYIGVERFWLYHQQDRIGGMAAWWDQRHFKQVVARSYHRYVHWALPVYNGFARLTGRVALPRPGHALRQSFIAFLALHPSLLKRFDAAYDLMTDLLSHCPTPVAALGLCDAHALTTVVARWKPLKYRTMVYAVEFNAPAQLDSRAVQPEVALL